MTAPDPHPSDESTESVSVDGSTVFANEPVDVAAIPQLPVGEFRPLHPNYRLVRLLGTAGGMAVPLVAAIAATVVLDLPAVVGRVAIGVSAVLLVLRLAIAWLEFPHLGWQVRDHDASTRHGLVARRTTTVPFSRVQHVAVFRGAVARLFGLAQLDLFTAGSGLADLRISGLTIDEAERLRSHVLARTIAEAGLAAGADLDDGDGD